MRLFPRNDTYFHLFEASADELTATAGAFASLSVASDDERLALASRLAGSDVPARESARVPPAVMNELERGFVTPFDREDILALAFELDDATASLRQAADVMVLHHATQPPDGFASVAQLVAKAADTAAGGVRSLRDLRSVSFGDLSQTLDGFVGDGRAAVRRMIADLFRFEDEHPARRVLQWRDVLDEVDRLLLHLSAIGRILETTVVKYS
jgi:uncharacterized protein Yka (UPF0111/DUF47 family)